MRHRLGDEQRRFEVQAEHGVVILFAHLDDRADAVGPGVVEQHVEGAARFDLAAHSRDVGHVEREGLGLEPGGAGRSLYSASKFALEGLTKCMAIELAPHGVRVNTLCPTWIETAMTLPLLEDPATRDWVLGKIKLGRLGKMEELSGALLLLASDASTLITGSSLVVDGGWTAG